MFPRLGARAGSLGSKIAESILLFCDPIDAILVSQACTAWRDFIANSPEILRFTYKLPTQAFEIDNPHMEQLSKLSLSVTIPHSDITGEKLWSRVREVKDPHIARLEELSPEEWDKKRSYDKDNQDDTYPELMYEIRAGLGGLRVGNVWPPSYQEIRCELCTYWHPKFRFDHLHPTLQFLDGLSTCIRGSGTKFIFKLRFISDWKNPMSAYKTSKLDALTFAKRMMRAYKEVAVGGVSHDLAARPILRKLIASGRWVVQNDGGLLLNEVSAFLIKAFHTGMLGYGHLLRRMGSRKHLYMKDRATYAEILHLYPALGDWVHHMERFDEDVNIWEAVMKEVDAIMSTLPTWQPLLPLYGKFDPTVDFEAYM